MSENFEHFRTAFEPAQRVRREPALLLEQMSAEYVEGSFCGSRAGGRYDSVQKVVLQSITAGSFEEETTKQNAADEQNQALKEEELVET